MANIPIFTNQLPGASYELPGHEIVKTDTGYRVRWLEMETPVIEGTAKYIARDILLRHSKVLNLPKSNIIFPFYGVIFVDWKPQLTCRLEYKTEVKGCSPQEFLDDLTAELEKLSNLLVFM